MKLLILTPEKAAVRVVVVLFLFAAGWLAITWGVAELLNRWQVWPISCGAALLLIAALSTWSMLLDMTREEANAGTDAVAQQGASGFPPQGR